VASDECVPSHAAAGTDGQREPRRRCGSRRQAAPPAQAGILATIGSTPLVQLARYLDRRDLRLFAKLEAFNPGGSSTDRPAAAILERGLASGTIRQGTVVVESSSGNLGVGLAQACRYHGLRFVCVVDSNASPLDVRILETYGAEVDRVTAPDPLSGAWLPARMQRVQELQRRIPDTFWPNQHAAAVDAEAHYHGTMAEVVERLDGRLDLLFIATSAGATIRGCVSYARDHRLPVRIIGVEAAGSVIFPAGEGQAGERRGPGPDSEIRLPPCDPTLVSRVVKVTDADCVRACRRLMDREAIFAGGSSGGVLAAVEKLAGWVPPDAVCVAILPDRGERYLDTVFDDAWVLAHLGDVTGEPGRAMAASWREAGE
jgi:N-(2-amino-2-carboxyethyl)-L-glutamate synthase